MPRKRVRSSQEGDQSPPRVLIADDDKQIKDGLRQLFKDAGFSVSCTGSLDGSVKALRNGEFDLVILDMRMPEKDPKDGVQNDAGLVATQLLMRFCQKATDTIVVVFTAYPSVADCFRSIDAGAYYLPKVLMGANANEGLFNECKRLVEERRRLKSAREETWLDKHYDELLREFGGKTIAVADLDLAKANKANLRGGKIIGNRVVFTASSGQKLRERIISDRKLRRTIPTIMTILEEAEPHE